MLVNGKWAADWHPLQSKDDQAEDDQGAFVRQASSFRNWITPSGKAGPTGKSGFKAESDRYHLYVALICPWASRALMVRKLKKLDHIIGVSVLEPSMTEQGWRFGSSLGADQDPLYGATYAHELYTKADTNFTGRATVPILWDKHRKTIVNNESADIVRMLNSAFEAHGNATIDLYPQDLKTEIDTLNAEMYKRLNNGVYQAGFTVSQAAYDEAVTGVFEMLDSLEEQLSDGRSYLFGERLTEADIRLFVTLVRFDVAYHGAFKCNIRRISDYRSLAAYTQRILNIPGISETVNIEHIKTGYYSIKAINPTGIVPAGPALIPSVGH